MTYRAIEISGLDVTLRLSKVTSIKVAGKSFIHFDELDDGTWRMTYNSLHIRDTTKVQSFYFGGGKLQIDGVDGAEDISMVAIKTTARMIHLDQLKDGRWKLLYNKEQFPRMEKASGLAIIREEAVS